MRSSREGSLVFVKVGNGEDVLPALESAANEHGVTSGLILNGIGMLKDVRLGYFNGKRSEKTGLMEVDF